MKTEERAQIKSDPIPIEENTLTLKFMLCPIFELTNVFTEINEEEPIYTQYNNIFFIYDYTPTTWWRNSLSFSIFSFSNLISDPFLLICSCFITINNSCPAWCKLIKVQYCRSFAGFKNIKMPRRGVKSPRLYIDGKDHLMGKLASYVAKALLQGTRVVVFNCDKINIAGSFYRYDD